MSTTVLFIGDPHFQVSNITEVELFMEKIINLATEKQPTFIVIAGDILHTHERLHTIALNKAYELVDNMRKIAPTYVLIGNHDMISNQQFLTNNHWMNAMKEWNNTKIIDDVLLEHINQQKFIFVPYVPNGRFEEALKTLKQPYLDTTCIFAHQEFAGCKMGAIISVEGDKWSLDNPLVVSGHIHSKQIPQKNIYYSGSAMQHAFGESEKNIIPLFTFNNTNNYDIEEIDLQLPRKKIIYMNVDDIDNYTVPETQDQLKVTVKGDYNEFKALKKTKKYKEMVENGIKVVFKPKKIDQNKKVTQDGVEKEIVDEVKSNDTNFNNILSSIVTEQKNPYLMQTYELVINGKDMELDDVLFL
jgi:DNA repair exonuclease SbcCD nuclease subunit